MKFVLTTDKKPIDPVTLKPASINDSSIHLDSNTASKLSKLKDTEIGAVIQSPYFAIDLDHCLVGGKWSQLSRDIVAMFLGAYVEISRSGTGIHIIGSLSGAFPPHLNKNTGLHIECYTESRLIVLTGEIHHEYDGDWDRDFTPAFIECVEKYFKPAALEVSSEWSNAPISDWKGPVDDDQLITKALASQSTAAAFGGGSVSFKDLWECNVEALADYYPDEKRNFDESSADLALCSHLAFWTGKDCERIERLFDRSALVRSKWIKRETYRHDTILQAVVGCRNVYNDPKIIAVEANAKIEGIRVGQQYMSIDQQIKHFHDCVYVADADKVVTSNGSVMNSRQFKAMFGGYVFFIDAQCDKTSKNAFEVFTESQAYSFPKAHSTIFKPLRKPGEVINVNGISLLNTWRVLNVDSKPGDPSPFMDLIEKLLPDSTDREILISYLAACVQHQGVKFQWWPVLQGAPGNGKNFVAYAVMEAIGIDHTHVPNSKDIANKFNKWMLGKTFIFVDEIDVADNRELLDALKPIITNTRLEIQGKGADQTSGDVCANGIMCMNHKDGINKTEDDRRYTIFFTDQQCNQDIIDCGMGGDYFPNLWNWARKGGFAYITHMLQNYNIDSRFNPAGGCHRAPEPSNYHEVLSESRSRIECDINEVIMNEPLGMVGGWISSISLHRVLREMRYSRKKLPDVLNRLGYIKHPSLREGRSPINVDFDCGKPRIYIKKDHICVNITDPIEVMNAYMKAQHQQTTNATYDRGNFKI